MPPKRDRPQCPTEQPRTHSNVLVPLICAAMNVPHTSIENMRIRFLGHFDGAIEEIRAVLSSMSSAPRLLEPLGGSRDRYIDKRDQDAVLERVFNRFFGGHLQVIQTSVAEAEAQEVLQMRHATRPEASRDQFSEYTSHFVFRDAVTGQSPMASAARVIATARTMVLDQFEANDSEMIHTAPSQQFRSQAFGDAISKSRNIILERLRNAAVGVRRCPHCGIMLLGRHGRTTFAEMNGWCCGGASQNRRHIPWPVLPWDVAVTDFSKSARVINSLLSVAVVHGQRDEGMSYRHLSYQAPVMTVNGQVYSRLVRDAKQCWFIHDADYDARLLALLQSAEETRILHRFTRLLQENNSLHRNVNETIHLHETSRASIILDEDTRMCSVFVDDGNVALPPARCMYVIGSSNVIDELDPAWEILGYPIMHFTGNATYAWDDRKVSVDGSRFTLLSYARSVMLTQPGFRKYGRLAEQYVLDMWARQEQQSVRVWKSPAVQDKLRAQAEASGRPHVEGKVYLPNSIPGCHAYQRRFFHDALHLSRTRGPSHLFVTMTCNPNWPEVRALLGSEFFDLKHESHQAILARVFVYKRKQLIARLKQNDYLFPGHCGLDWIVYSTEWQKGDLPHAHIAARLRIDTSRVSMNTQQDQINLMDVVVSAQIPSNNASHYHQVIAFMQHPQVCKSCLREKPKGSGTKSCRFYFPKPVCQVSRIDARGFPVYQRSDEDVRAVPHNWKLLLEFDCHINVEWTFNSRHLAYVYGYMCKGVDVSGVRIKDQTDEIASFRRTRILTIAEACYRILGFNVNFRDPAVVVCPIHLPHRRNHNCDNDQFGHVCDGNDEFGEHELPQDQFRDQRQQVSSDIAYKLDYLEHYFEADRHDSMKFTEYYSQYYASTMYIPRQGNTVQWNHRQYPIEARMTWYPPYAGEIYYLRMLLNHVAARNWSDLYGGCSTFKAHCIYLGIVDTGEEYWYAMQDALASNQSPAACRHLLALFISCQDALSLDTVWGDQSIRDQLCIDFWPSEARGEYFFMDTEKAEMLALMDVAAMVQRMGSTGDSRAAMLSKDLPQPIPLEHMHTFHTQVADVHLSLFTRYASVVGYSVRTRRQSPALQREIIYFREHTKVLLPEALDREIALLNEDQRPVFDRLLFCFFNPGSNPRRLFNVNASAGCGKTFLMVRVLYALRREGAITASVCSIGIGALQFDDGRTVHSLFNVPIQEETDVLTGIRLVSSLIKQLENGPTARTEFLRALDVLVWDEIGAISKHVFLCVDHLFRAIMGNNLPFGGKFVVTLGDWRQIPPVDDSDGHVRFWDGDQVAFASIFHISVKSTPLYEMHFEKLTLSINERAKHDLPFQRSCDLVGDGILGPDIPIELLTAVGVRVFYTVEESCTWLFETDIPQPYDPVTVSQRAILSPFNADVDGINEYCEAEFVRFHGGEIMQLLSVDEFIGADEDTHVEDDNARPNAQNESERIRSVEHSNLAFDLDEHLDDVVDNNDHGATFDFDVTNAVETVHLGADAFASENLNDLKFKGVPPHRLKLFRGAVVILLRNLDAGNRLQNGVRLIVKDFVRGRDGRHPRVIIVTKAEDEREWKTGDQPVRTFLLHRIKFPCKLGPGQDAVICRRQFPVRQCNGISIHKSQSMTLDRSILDVRTGVFEHGQFFVGYSRCRRGKDTGLLIRNGQTTVRNIVLQRFLEDAVMR